MNLESAGLNDSVAHLGISSAGTTFKRRESVMLFAMVGYGNPFAANSSESFLQAAKLAVMSRYVRWRFVLDCARLSFGGLGGLARA